MPKISVCSFSFHRRLADGEMDFFQYVETCRELGCTHLQPWSVHYARGLTPDDVFGIGHHPGQTDIPDWMHPPTDRGYIRDIRQAVVDSGLEMELVALDRGYVYLADEALRHEHRQYAREWLDAAGELGIPAFRIDPGEGSAEMPDDEIDFAIAEYKSLMADARSVGVRLYIENHWGLSQVPRFINRLLDEVEGLQYLFDSNNWGRDPENRQRGWNQCAHRATATHLKPRQFTEEGKLDDPLLVDAVRLLKDRGFDGVWGIESIPAGKALEIEAVAATIRHLLDYEV